MTTVQRLVGLILALVLTAFATPSLAQKNFNLSGFEAFSTFAPGETKGFDDLFDHHGAGTITVTNNSPGNSNFNSFRVTAPPGLKILGAKKPTSNTRAGAVSTPGTNSSGRSFFNVTGINPSVQRLEFFTVNLKVQAGCTNFADQAWLVEVYTGGDLKGQPFTLNPTPFPTSTVIGTTQCVVQFVSELAPASTTADKVITSATNSAAGAGVRIETLLGGVRDTTFTGTVGIQYKKSIDSDTTYQPLQSYAVVAADLGLGKFGNSSANSGPTLQITAPGLYSLRPVVLNGSTVILAGDPVPIIVSAADGTLDCAGNNIVDPSVTGPDWEVKRYEYIYAPKSGCTPINYLATLGTASKVTDPAGFVLGTDFFSIIYNEIPSEGVLLTHEYISTVYPVLASGEVKVKKVKYCAPGLGDGECTNANGASLPEVPACLDGLIAQSAIPGTVGEYPGCLRSYGWFSVACGAVSNFGKGCVRYQIGLLEAKDPPWGLTDE